MRRAPRLPQADIQIQNMEGRPPSHRGYGYRICIVSQRHALDTGIPIRQREPRRASLAGTRTRTQARPQARRHASAQAKYARRNAGTQAGTPHTRRHARSRAGAQARARTHGQRAPLPRCTWRGKRPAVGRFAACCGRAFSAPAGQEVPAWVARGRPRRSGGLRPRAAGTAARQEKDFVTHIIS